MSKDDKIVVKLSRKQIAPKNVAAQSLRAGQFQPKVEAHPKAYKRRKKHPEVIAVPDDDASE